MARKLARRQYAAGQWWEPEDNMPEEVAATITNPKAWEAGDAGPDGKSARPPIAGYEGHLLSGYVHLGNERYGPFDPVPEDAARRITNPKAWVAGEVPQFVDSDTAEPGDEEPAAPTRRSTVPPPPRVGRGSGIEAWASFAEANDVDVPDGASRDEIIAACEDAGALDRS